MSEFKSQGRIQSIDLLKGLVMAIMALDHVRDYFHCQAYFFNPVDPTQSPLPVFFTRWITHFCAPVFCFLAGLSAYMSGRKKSKSALSGFLLKRGLWLLLMELTLVTFAWQFDPQFRINGLAVIGTLGISMIFLAGLIHLPKTVILIFCSLIILGHNLLDKIQLPGNFLWSIIHHAEVFTFSDSFKFYVDYPIIPWIAVMPLGYWFGSFYNNNVDSSKRKRLFTIIGISAVCSFVLIRWLNFYGDPLPWTKLDSGSKTLMSFLNLNKYPPSLLYLLVTLGAALIFLGNTENLKGKLVNFFTTFGRVPFFYYLLHLYIIHLLAALFAQLSGFGWKLLVLPDWILETPTLKGYGFNLAIVYLVWLSVIAINYPLCKWYDKYKNNHREKWWLSYL